MQVKITIVYSYIPDKMAKVRKIDNIRYWEECEATRTCWWKCILWKTSERVWHFHRNLSTNLPNELVILFLGICPEEMKTHVYKILNTNIYSSCIHNNLKLATTLMSINREMDKQTVIYPCSGIIFSNEKKQTTNVSHSINEFQKYYAEWKKPDTKEYIFYYFIYMKLFKM